MAEQEFKKRQTAFRVSIGMISSSDKIHFDENQRFRFLDVNGKEVYRINLIANVIDKFESSQKQYVNITLDDGTGNVRVKAFADSIHLLQNINLGDSVLMVGVLRFYNDELYIMPEIVKTIDPKWLLARKLELEEEYGALYANTRGYETLNESTSTEPVQEELRQNFGKSAQESENVQEKEEVVVEKIDSGKLNEPSLRDKIVEMIKEKESEGGLDIEKLIMAMKDPVDMINKEITVLLEEGSIYEPKPGRLRIL